MRGRMSKLPRAAEGADGKRDEEQSNANRNTDQPVSEVASPSPQRGIKPGQGQHREYGPDRFVK